MKNAGNSRAFDAARCSIQNIKQTLNETIPSEQKRRLKCAAIFFTLARLLARSVCILVRSCIFCNPYHPAFVYVSAFFIFFFFHFIFLTLCLSIYLSRLVVLCLFICWQWLREHTTDFICISKYMQRMKWIMTKLSPVLVVFMAFFFLHSVYLGYAIKHKQLESECVLFVYLPFTFFCHLVLLFFKWIVPGHTKL